MQNISSVKSQVSQRALWQSMRSRYFFPKMSVNCLIHLSDHRRLLVISHTVFPMWWVRVSYFSSLQPSVFLKVVTLEYWRYWQKYAVHRTESDVSCSFLSSVSLRKDEEGWDRDFGAVSRVRKDMYVVRDDCSSATLHMQFKLLAPHLVVRNSTLTCCHVKMSSTLPPFFSQPLYF